MFPELTSSENSFLAKCLLLSLCGTRVETCWSGYLGIVAMLATVLLKQLSTSSPLLQGPWLPALLLIG